MRLSRLQTWAIIVAVMIIAVAGVYRLFGLRGGMTRDIAGYLYAGQHVAEGVPPYVSIFTHKGPLSPLLIGASIAAGRLIHLDDIYAARLVFMGVGLLAVLSTALLASDLLRSQRAFLLAGFAMLTFLGLTHHATSGPDPKLPMLPFQALALLLTARRRWFWAGVCGALVALVWQPMGIYIIVAFILACLRPRQERLRAAGLVVAGGLIPTALIVAYFAYMRALPALADGYVVFNVLYLERGSATFGQHLWVIADRVIRSYRIALPIVLLGFAAMIGLWPWRRRRAGSWKAALTTDPFAPVLLTFPLPIIWSLKDFQGPADFFVFIPYCALGVAVLGELGLQALERRQVSPLIVRAILAGACVGMFVGGALDARAGRNTTLDAQRDSAAMLRARFGDNMRVLSLERPEPLVLLHKTQPDPFLWSRAGFDRYIQVRYPGGFAGLLEGYKRFDPDVVGILSEHVIRPQYHDELLAWLKAGYVKEQFGLWVVYYRKGLGK